MSGMYGRITKELRDNGYPISFSQARKHPFDYQSDMPLSDFRFENELRRTKVGFSETITGIILKTRHFFWAVKNFDTFVFVAGSSFAPRNLDLYLLRLFRKRIVSLVGHGSEARPAFMDGAHWSIALETTDPLRSIQTTFLQQKRHMRRIERLSDLVVAHPLTAQLLRRPAVASLYIGIPVPDTRPISPLDRYQGSLVRIVHAPSDRRAKGSDKIQELVNSVNSELIPLNYVELHGVSNAEVIANIAQSDIVVDQMYSDTRLAGLGTEAASLGVAVLVGSYGVLELEEHVHQDYLPPALVVHPKDFDEAFLRLLENRAYRESVANACESFVSSKWSVKSVAERFLLVVNGGFPLDWYFDPLRISYVHGSGLEESELISIWNCGTARFGQAFLNIPIRRDLYEKMQIMMQNAATK
jgi:hypothetical protein